MVSRQEGKYFKHSIQEQRTLLDRLCSVYEYEKGSDTWAIGHMTDNHFKLVEDEEENIRMIESRARLIKKHCKMNSLDAFIITGDLFDASNKEFTKRYMQILLANLAMDNTQVIFVPGNHDLRTPEKNKEYYNIFDYHNLPLDIQRVYKTKKLPPNIRTTTRMPTKPLVIDLKKNDVSFKILAANIYPTPDNNWDISFDADNPDKNIHSSDQYNELVRDTKDGKHQKLSKFLSRAFNTGYKRLKKLLKNEHIDIVFCHAPVTDQKLAKSKEEIELIVNVGQEAHKNDMSEEEYIEYWLMKNNLFPVMIEALMKESKNDNIVFMTGHNHKKYTVEITFDFGDGKTKKVIAVSNSHKV